MINKYQDLIKQLPIEEHGFSVQRKVWKQFENKYTWYKEINETIFDKKEVIFITRKRLKQLGQTDNCKQFIFETIYWGYPKGYTDGRNIQFETLLTGIDSWVELVEILKKDAEINNFEEFYKKHVVKVKGLGLSTFTKILQFLGTKINKKEPLILDNQIISRLTISQFRDDKFDNLRYDNGVKFYEKYLEHIQILSSGIDTEPERIEMFLFIFGGILISTDT